MHLRVSNFALVALTAVLLLYSASASASSGSFSIGGGQVHLSAENFSRDFEKGTVEVSGKVNVVFNGQFLSCDRAVINEKIHQIEAFGNFVLSSPQTYVEGDAAILDYKANTGIIQNGFVKNGQVILEGRVVRKTGPDSYDAERAYFTACTTCPTAWTFSGTRMNARMGGYAFIKNPILRVADFPVLWLPYLVVPLKSERQTGLLTPDIDIYTDEVALGLPFFWAISRSQDATLTPKYYTRRGLKILGNYRYVLNEDSWGEANGAIINDQQFGSDDKLNELPGGSRSRRWFFNYVHEYKLPGELSQKTKLNLVSDLRYPNTFWKETPGKGEPALENRFSLSRNTESTHSSLDVGYYINMMKSNPFADNRDAVHRWPELKFSLIDRQVMKSNLLFRFDVDYVNFVREGYAYDRVIAGNTHSPSGLTYPRQIDTNHSGWVLSTPDKDTRVRTPLYVGGGGQFNPSADIVRSGQRLDLRPEVAYPFNVGRYLDALPSLEFRHTQYVFSVTPAANDPTPYDSMPFRDYMRARLSLRTTFYRIYGDQESLSRKPDIKPPSSNWVDEESRAPDDEKLKAPKRVHPDIYRHEVQPEVVASYIPFIRQPDNHPFFTKSTLVPVFLEDQPISDANFNDANQMIQFDYNDRLTSRTLVTLQITNRLVRKRWLSGTPDYRQVASWRIGESYDFDEAKRQDPPRLPYSDIFSILDVHFDRVDLNSKVNYYPYHKVMNSTSYIKIKNARGTQYGQISYGKTYNITREVEKTKEAPETVSLGGGLASTYVDMDLNFNYAQDTDKLFKLTSWSGNFNIKPPGNCWGIKLQYAQPINEKPEIHINFDFNFSGFSG